eukprot:m.155542 g.155542  ORF g.155542 m.155542 type:complete len:110 (+) comp38676_c0_seq3:551-880(+)
MKHSTVQRFWILLTAIGLKIGLVQGLWIEVVDSCFAFFRCLTKGIFKAIDVIPNPDVTDQKNEEEEKGCGSSYGAFQVHMHQFRGFFPGSAARASQLGSIISISERCKE